MDKPFVIEGGFFEDERGVLTFVNDFKFTTIERFYIISNSKEKPIRAWQGHKLDAKNFFCIQGSFKISYVAVDNWEFPSQSAIVESCVLNANEPKVLHIPPGYANAIQSLEEYSKLLSFSTLPLSHVGEDDVRYNIDMWKI